MESRNVVHRERSGRARAAFGLAASLLGVLALAGGASAQGTGRPPGTKVVRNGEREAVLVPIDQAREGLSPEERELLDLRERMRELRTERRDAMQRARASGDPQALARVQEEFRPRMEALRDDVREARDTVMEIRLRENPELAARLEARTEGRERFECGAGPGQASEEARRRAFRRLQAIAPEGTLDEPADIPTPVREELQSHARRVALLQCIRARARGKSDAAAVQRTRLVLRAEQQRHDRTIRELLGAAPPSSRPGREAAAPGTDEPTSDGPTAPALAAPSATEEVTR